MAPYVLSTLAFVAAALASSSADTCLTAGANSRKIIPDGKWFAQQYHTIPYLPPYFRINSTGAALSPGLIFLATLPGKVKGNTEPAPLIIDDTGELVWVDPKVRGYNFHPQLYNGSVVLPYWDGQYSKKPSVGHGFGSITLLDDQYNKIKTICPNLKLNTVGNKKYACEIDLHESQLTDRNTILGSAYNVRQADLTSVGGSKNGHVFAGTVVEIDVATQKVLFEWQSIDHVPVTDSKIGLTGGRGSASFPYDYFHLNSIQLVGENYLVNSRQTWSVFLISPKGKVLWQLEGENGGDFGALPKNAKFHWAHHVRAIAQDANSMTITIFNNDNGSPRNPALPSTGLTLRLPMPPGSGKVEVLRRVAHVPPIFNPAEGSYQAVLADGKNQFMSYGFFPYIAEFGPNNAQLWTAQFASGKADHSYRGFKQQFHTIPKTAPTLVVKNGSKCKTAYVSWNGATDIDSWAVYSGKSKSKLAQVGTVKKAGFETGFGVSGKCIRVTAMSAGKRVRNSNVVCGLLS